MAFNMEERIPVETFVIFKIETTDYPWKGFQRSKMVEICCLPLPKALLEEDAKKGALKTVLDNKFFCVINPERPMDEEASQATGIFNEIFEDQNPTFGQLFESFETFLENLPKPVCLVAHNGNAFDFRILKFECKVIEKVLPEDLLTADSMRAFQNILKGTPEKKKYGLPALYKRYLGNEREPMRAEEKAEMLLEVIIQNKALFLQWANENRKEITEIKPFYDYAL